MYLFVYPKTVRSCICTCRWLPGPILVGLLLLCGLKFWSTWDEEFTVMAEFQSASLKYSQSCKNFLKCCRTRAFIRLTEKTNSSDLSVCHEIVMSWCRIDIFIIKGGRVALKLNHSTVSTLDIQIPTIIAGCNFVMIYLMSSIRLTVWENPKLQTAQGHPKLRIKN